VQGGPGAWVCGLAVEGGSERGPSPAAMHQRKSGHAVPSGYCSMLAPLTCLCSVPQTVAAAFPAPASCARVLLHSTLHSPHTARAGCCGCCPPLVCCVHMNMLVHMRAGRPRHSCATQHGAGIDGAPAAAAWLNCQQGDSRWSEQQQWRRPQRSIKQWGSCCSGACQQPAACYRVCGAGGMWSHPHGRIPAGVRCCGGQLPATACMECCFLWEAATATAAACHSGCCMMQHVTCHWVTLSSAVPYRHPCCCEARV
jgi:hypothetical protein